LALSLAGSSPATGGRAVASVVAPPAAPISGFGEGVCLPGFASPPHLFFRPPVRRTVAAPLSEPGTARILGADSGAQPTNVASRGRRRWWDPWLAEPVAWRFSSSRGVWTSADSRAVLAFFDVRGRFALLFCRSAATLSSFHKNKETPAVRRRRFFATRPIRRGAASRGPSQAFTFSLDGLFFYSEAATACRVTPLSPLKRSLTRQRDEG
jgi:hypothetical protein